MLKTKTLHIIIPLWLSIMAASCGKHVETVHAPSPALSVIDSLMWRQPDSALAVMMQFVESPEADSLNEFEEHYCQVLVAELLFKNHYAQSNRIELMAAMDYFDSLCGRDGACTVSTDNVFLDARVHYMNGVGYYEHDSLVPACAEFLHTLQIMESRFSENELVGKKARFMALTHNRLMELFSHQFMQESAIYCGKRSLAYDSIAHSKPSNMAGTLLYIGKQYAKMNEYDSAAYYYDLMLNCIPDRNTVIYRDWVAVTAMNNYETHHDTIAVLDSLKSIIALSTNESERLNRYLTIGGIYNDIGQYDSAKFYWEPVFEKEVKVFNLRIVSNYLREIALKEGDTLKADRYAQVMAENTTSPGESQARVSQLNDMFQSYLLEKQEATSLRERKMAIMTTLLILLALAMILAVVTIVIRRRHRKHMATQEKAAQRRLSETEHKLKSQVEQALQQAQTMLPHRVNDIYHSKVSNRTERIMAEFEAAYPGALGRLAKTHPGLTETERQIAVLNFLRFRSKEEADLLGFTENTIFKYRSNLKKKASSDPISPLLAERKTE